MRNTLVVLCSLLTFVSHGGFASQDSGTAIWTQQQSEYIALLKSSAAREGRGDKLAKSADQILKSTYFHLDYDKLSSMFSSHDATTYLVDIPLPAGGTVKYQLAKANVMAESLQQRFPSIMSFTGFQLDNPNNIGHFNFSSVGFHGAFFYQNEKVYLDPDHALGSNLHQTFFRNDTQDSLISDQVIKRADFETDAFTRAVAGKASLDDSPQAIRTYRLAVSASGEYTAFHGGTVKSGLAAVVTMVNRLNLIFVRELGIQFVLVANNDQIIFTDAQTDPFENNDNDGSTNVTVINDAIGTENYDLGHVVNTGAGGLAVLSGLCGFYKADGVTGRGNPQGDSFWVDYVAHEIGHQLGADHTFNGTTGACASGRSGAAAYEAGSGVTIMSYAGICGGQNLANRTLEHYHAHSIAEMRNVIQNRQCGVDSGATNRHPVVSAGADYTIPANTPFEVLGQATDSNNDDMTYDWQQLDLGPATSSKAEDQTDQGSGPLFRVFDPVNVPTRAFPRLLDVLNSATTYGETMPSTNRDINLRLVVRDGNGGVNYDDMVISVVDTGEAFSVITPTSGQQISEPVQSVEWNVAGTNDNGINCSAVDILLSTDNGASFEQILASGVSNTGQANVQIMGIQAEQARLKIKCTSGVFYAVNNGSFSVSTATLVITGQQALTIDEDTSLTIETSMLTVVGAVPDSLLFDSGENYTVEGNTITPASHYSGQLLVPVRAVAGDDTSETFNLAITVNEVNDAPMAQNDVVEVAMNSSDNVINVLSNDTDVENQTLRITAIAYQGNGSLSFNDSQLTYTPESGFVGQEQFTYTIADSEGLEHSASVTVSVVDNTVVQPPAPPTDDGGSSGGTFAYSVWLLFLLSAIRLRRKSIGRSL